MMNNENFFAEQAIAPVATTKASLDKKGVTILVVSLVMAFVFILIGTIMLVAPLLENNETNNNSSNTPSTATTSVYEGIAKYIYTTGYQTYTFQPDSTGYYYIYCSDCEVDSVKTSSGTGVTPYRYSSFVSVYLSSGKTYSIRVYSERSGSNFYISDN